MPQRVVDFLEVIEIDEHQRNRQAATVGFLISCSMRSRNMRRFGKPVRVSKLACFQMTSSVFSCRDVFLDGDKIGDESMLVLTGEMDTCSR